MTTVGFHSGMFMILAIGYWSNLSKSTKANSTLSDCFITRIDSDSETPLK